MFMSMSAAAAADAPAPPQKPKKNTKTFSGCWTCRVRKVKCDEAKPHCLQCRRKGTQCEGYGVRLQWVNDNDNDAESPNMLPARSKITPDANSLALSYSRVNHILNTLDSLDSQCKATGTKDISVFIEFFGAFGTGQEAPPVPMTQTCTTKSITDSRDEISLVEVDSSPSPIGEQSNDNSPLSSCRSFGPCGGGDNQVLTFDQITDLGHVDDSPNEIDVVCMEDHNVIEDGETQLPLNFSDSLTATSFILFPTPSFLSCNERFLLYHYAKRVLYIFCVVDHEKSPWKTIHLSRALHAVGELTVQGTTSRIQNALTSTLLATSAFLLANDNKLSHRTDEARNWRTAAENYRGKAIKLLRDAVEQEFYHESPPKYKDFLATTLSMITINVVSGDIETCGIHLDGAFRLITHAQKWKRTYSPKAQSLHRIYFYLRAIYESTAPRQCNANRRLSLSNEPRNSDPSRQDDIFCRHLLDEQMRGYEPGLNLDFDSPITSCERIYGIPHSLLYLLTRVIDLINKMPVTANTSSAGLVPEHLVGECDDVERRILAWPEAVNLQQSIDKADSASSRIVYHHTLAFHNALVIYFAQHIPLVGHRFLQPYVTAVLKSMEAIEMFKIGAETLAAPLYWPAFIAGSEAFEKGLQDRFRLWYDHVQVYRIEALRTGIKVLTEIWEAGPSTGPRTTCYWRAAIERLDIRLMLS
ncbi:Component of the argr regulatory complex [Fusarium pseudocircinatum]|uniref:Component of the argr regulatory complex n=1 Tax=Fusarium pseudocircinatum TaxID=56676 RepID=A0A8H5PKV4_9HYPO|nr:Component of the argr regulatory complex [Fusarium pseudocircinatum]